MTAQNHTPLCGCGKPLKVFASSGRTQIMCADCRKKRKTPAPTSCAHCGVSLEGIAGAMRFCSKQCRVTYHEAARRKHPPGYRAVQPVECKGCGVSFVPKTRRYSSYCTRECALSHCSQWQAKREKRDPLPAYSRVYADQCLKCNNPFVARVSRKYCSQACQPSYTRAPLKRCKVCDAPFQAQGTQLYCGSVCAEVAAAPRKRASRLRGKLKRRSVTVETVDPIKVFDRDGWRCKLCGVKTPPAKRGTYEPDAPELDHIIPIACGGEHSYRNTQCACRECNGNKRDRPLGQLLIFG